MNEFDILVSDEYYDKLAYENISDIVLVNNTKIKKYKIGNHIFVVNEQTRQKFEAVVEGFLYFDTLVEAFSFVGKKYLGFSGNTSMTKLEDKFLTMYKAQDIEKHGIVVISYTRI